MKLMTNGRKLLLAGVALTACLGFAFNAQAQCTVANWTTPANLSDTDAGTQDDENGINRRYGGPCGLQVDIDGTTRSLLTDAPLDEVGFNVRFYTFLDNAGSDPILLFNADDGAGSDLIQVWYNSPASGNLTLRVFDAGGPTDFVETPGSGWHSVEFAWAADVTADVRYSVDGETDIQQSLDTSGQTIANAEIGNLNGANTGGTVDFDDFDSRRSERPGRLLVADANGDGVVDIFDALDLRDELAETSFAPGQPDCEEDGDVDIFDALCLRDKLI